MYIIFYLSESDNWGDNFLSAAVLMQVRSMHAKDHYEMREYNMDVIPDGNASNASGTERPYPIYPSKGGVNPNILKSIISRSAH